MLAFSIPPSRSNHPLAFLHGSYANWAAPAFISAAILVSAVLVREQMWTWLEKFISPARHLFRSCCYSATPQQTG